MVKRKFISILTAVIVLATTVISGTVTSFAGSSSVYCKQDARGYCTLASAVMMMRQKALDEGNPGWKNITQSSTKSVAWLEGQGLRHSFTYKGISVGYGEFKSGAELKETLKTLLSKHPEGFEIYDRNLPHAVFLTRYEAYTDTFYCGDPVYGYEQPLAESWLRTGFKSITDEEELQEAIVNGLEAYWFVSAYTPKVIEAVVADTKDDEEDGDDISADNSTSAGNNTSAGNSSSQDDAVNCPANGVVDDNRGNTSSGNTQVNVPSTTPVSVDDTSTGSYYYGANIGGMSDPSESLSNEMSDIFNRVNNFNDVYFPDVDRNEWYYRYIEEAYELGLMSGQDSGEFDIDGEVTIAQCVTMAARIHSIYTDDRHSFNMSGSQEWYDPYVDYAYDEGIIEKKYTKSRVMNESATRAEFAEIIGAALPSGALIQVNSVDDGAILDVESSTSAGKMIYTLYRAGIMTGYSDGTFDPNNTITRSQVAAIIVRMADPSKRVRM